MQTTPSAPVIAFEPKGLDAVDWGRLSHAYGSAESIPVFIRNLGAEDSEVRQEAFHALLMTILHQGSLYTATVAAIPFLLRIVEAPSHPARVEAMDFVQMIVNECRFDDYQERREALLAAGDDPLKHYGDEPDLVAAISEALWADMDLLTRLQSDEDLNIRDMVQEVIEEMKGTSGGVT